MNQLTTVTRGPGSVMTVAGTTTMLATNVTVNTSNALRYADRTFASTNHTLADGTNTFTAIALDDLGRADTNSISVYLPNSVSFLYDQNGNMRTNGTRVFQYDDENQLICITEPGAWMCTNVYDGKMRRRVEQNYNWTAGAWVLTSETRFVYDGNVILQERDSFNLPKLTLTRGLDLSGTLQGAGGIGGLLAITEHALLNAGATTNSHFYYHADGNGNVTCVADVNQNVVARYLYDPFGNTLSATGPKAALSRYRFSSKPLHESSGMYDYLYRWYVPELQRWLSRDPLSTIPRTLQPNQAGRDNYSSDYFVSENRFPLGSAPADLQREHSFSARLDFVDNNLFEYAKNSPLVYVDAYGLWYLDLGFSGGFIGGGTVGFTVGSGGFHFYLGGGLTTPGFGVSLQVGQGDPTPKWNWACGVNAIGSFQVGQGIPPRGAPQWLEWGLGFPPGIGGFVYYVW